MKKPSLVIACFGDAQSAAQIAELSARADVIAVAFDFGGVVSLSDMHDVAVGAGAVRCHALDVREDFARELVRCAARRDRFESEDTSALVAQSVVARKLQEIASLEVAGAVECQQVPVLHRRPIAPAPGPLHLAIRFENGIPVAVNGVEMSPAEIIESLETITGESALSVLHRYILNSPDLQLA